MPRRNRIVVIGGVACGPKAAARARRCDPEAELTIIEEGSLISYAGCGLPYYISGVIKKRSDLLARSARYFKNVADIDVLTRTRAEAIDRAEHRVELLNLEDRQRTTLEYDKLVLATGSSPVIPPIEGRELSGIHALKEAPDADSILNLLTSQSARRAVIVGAGLIGLEMAETLVERGVQVTVDFRLGERVARFEGEGGVVRLAITEREALETDIVIMAIGVRPNVRLAREAFATVKGDKRCWSFVYALDADFVGLLENSLPFFWKPSLNRLFAAGSSLSAPRASKRVTPQEKAQKAREMRSQGASYREIGRALGVKSRSTIPNYIRGYPYAR